MAGTAGEIFLSGMNYQGQASAGGYTYAPLDTKPLEDLAKYTMLYNRAEYEQRQKDAEAAANQISEITSYDLTTGISKDAKLLQEKYDKVTAYVRDNPNALDYRNKKEWTEYRKMRSDLENDLKGAKVRNVFWLARQKEIQDETDVDKRKLMQAELDKEIADTDIRTPLKHSQQYADNQIKLPTAPELSFDVIKTAPNGIITRDYKVFNVPKARSNGDVFALGLDKVEDLSTPQGQRDALAKKKNFWVQGAEVFNDTLNAKDPMGEFLYKKKMTDVQGNVTYELDESKLSKLPRNILNLVKETNEYLAETKADIKAGNLLDKFEKPITFGQGALDENDYAEINYKDGISPEELAVVAQYAQWKGDTYSTKVQPTDNAIQLSAQALAKRGQDLENSRFWAGYNKGSAEDLLSADAVIKEVSDAVNSGTPTQVVEYKGNKRIVRDNVVTIGDPNLLKEFGSIDKDGNVTNVPSVVHYNEKTNKLALVYYKPDESGTGYAKKEGTNEPIVEREVDMQPTQWLGQVTRRKNPNKDIGGVNSLIEQVYSKYGRNLKKMATDYMGGATISTGSKTTESGRVGGSVTETPEQRAKRIANE